MLEVFTGKLGGGKSYHAVKRAVAQFLRGGCVVTNVGLNVEAVREHLSKRYNRVFNPDALRIIPDEYEEMEVGGKRILVHCAVNFHKYVPAGSQDLPVLVIIDEAHLYFNSRDFAVSDRTSRELFKYITQSRKLGNDIIMITQDYRNLDAQFIRMLQYLWTFRDLDRYRILGLPWPSAWPLVGGIFPNILAQQLDLDGKTILKTEPGRRDGEIFKLYSTNQLLMPIQGLCAERFEGASLEVSDQTKKRKVMSRLIVILCLGIGFFAYTRIKSKKADEVAGKAPPVETARDPRPVRNLEPVPHDPALDDGWQAGEGFLYRVENLAGVTSRVAHTDRARYCVGETSPVGIVQRIGGGTVTIAGFDGRRYVVHLVRARRNTPDVEADAETGIGG